MEHIQIEKDGDIIFCTLKKYKMFLAQQQKGESGMDAYMLYSHYMFTGRLQDTNQVWSSNVYLKKGLGWGSDRIKKANDLLKKLGLIEKIDQSRKEEGRYGKQYIKIITVNPLSQSDTVDLEPVNRENREPSDRSTVSSNKCLKEQLNNLKKEVKCLKEQNKCLIKDGDKSPIVKKLKKEHKDVIRFEAIFNKVYVSLFSKEYKLTGKDKADMIKRLPSDLPDNEILEKMVIMFFNINDDFVNKYKSASWFCVNYQYKDIAQIELGEKKQYVKPFNELSDNVKDILSRGLDTNVDNLPCFAENYRKEVAEYKQKKYDDQIAENARIDAEWELERKKEAACG